MRNIIKIAVPLIACILILCACAGDKEHIPVRSFDEAGLFPYINNVEDTFYSSVKADIDYRDEDNRLAAYPVPYQDKICLVIPWRTEDDSGDTVHIIDCAGRVNKTFDIDCNDSSHFCSIDDQWLISAGHNDGIRKFDFDGTLIKTSGFDDDFLCGLTTMVPYSKGFILIGYGGALLFDKDCNETGRCSFHSEYSPINDTAAYEQNGMIYFLAYCFEGEVICQIDPETWECSVFANMKDFINPGATAFYDGPFIRTDASDYFYIVDPATVSLKPVLKKSNMTVIPSTMTTFFDPEARILNNGIIVYIYSYSEQIDPDIIIVSKDDDLNISAREEIVIKGYGAERDPALAYAAEKYNSMQDQYYVRILEYEDEYQFSSEHDLLDIQLRLMQEFMSDTAPDMYFSREFDYQYWGRSGVVADISSYLDERGILDEDKISPNILPLMKNPDGSVYQVFAGYSVGGYWGDSNIYTQNEYAYNNMPSLPAGVRRMGDRSQLEIVDSMIRYDLIWRYSNNEMLSEAEIKNILDYAVENGYEPNSNYSLTSPEEVRDGEVSLFHAYIATMTSYLTLARDMDLEPRCIGIPMINGSAHLVEPKGLVAVSAGSDNIEACCDFIACMFEYRAQERMVSSEWIPVDERALQRHVSSTNCSDTLKELYLENIHSADTLLAFDWAVVDMIEEELGSYYEGRSTREIAHTLHSRLQLYASENYS